MAPVRDWDFDERPLHEVLSEVQRATGLSFQLEEGVDRQMRVSIRIARVNAHVMLSLLLAPRGLKYSVSGRTLWIQEHNP